MGGFQNRPFNNRIDYSQAAGPVTQSGRRPARFSQQITNNYDEYDEPAGPVTQSGRPPVRTSPTYEEQNYNEPSKSTPSFVRSPQVQGPVTKSGTLPEKPGGRMWERALGETYRPGMNIIYVVKKLRDLKKKNPSKSKGYDAAIADAKADKRLAITALNLKPEQILPGKTLQEVESLYKKKRAKAVAAGKMQFVEALDKALVVRRQQLGGSPKKTPSGFTPSGKTPAPTSPERDAEMLLPGKTEDAVKKIYANRKAKALKKGDKAMVDRLDRALPVRLQRLKTQGANVMKVSPERLIPGTTIEQVEKTYKDRRAAAVQKKRQALVAALDKAIIVRRKQLGGSPKKTPSGFTPSGKTPAPTSPERDAEMLLPGKTEDAVRRIYSNRKAKALKKGDKAMVDRLDRALPIRLQRLKTQGANVMKVSPERLIPGTTIEQVEKAYKDRRAAAVQKKRQALVAALDKAIIARRKQLGGSPKKGLTLTGKTPAPTSPERDAEMLLPGKTEDAVRRIYSNRKAKALKKGDKAMVDRLDRALPVRLQRLKTQGANVMKVSPERLIPGVTIAEIEKAYKDRRAAAVQKKRQALVAALDKAIIVRRKQLGGKTPSPQGKKFSGLASVPPEVLLPGKTPQNVEKVYKQKRSAAVAKKRKELVEALNKAYEVRKKQSFKSPQKDAEAEKRAREAERLKKIELEKKKTIDAQIVQTKRKIKKVTESAQKATTNVQRFQKEVESAAKRRDTTKASKFSKVLERRRQNLVRFRTSREKLIANLKRLEKERSSPSTRSPIILGQTPVPKMRKVAPSPLVMTNPQKSVSKTALSPAKTTQTPIDQQKRDQEKKRADMLKKQQFESKKKQETERKRQEDAKKRQQSDLKKKQEAERKRQEDAKKRQQMELKKKQEIERKRQQDAKKRQDMERKRQMSMQKQLSQKRSMVPRTPSPIRRKR